jgi:uncharacterized membrane protein
MNALGKLFLKGLAVVVPVVLTLAILWWMATGSEHLLGNLLQRVLPPGWYIPGMGLIAGLSLIAFVGLLSHVIIFQRLFNLGERILEKLPLVKTIYSALKDFTGYLNPDRQSGFRRVVLVRMPGHEFQIIGFITREHFDDLPLKPDFEEPVAVYMPMSYQIGGYTIFVPKSALTPLDIGFEDAMRLALTGAITSQQEPD